MKQEIIKNENVKIQELLEGYLRFRSAAKPQNEAGAHLDEDALANFVEGNLSRRENNSFISHLIECAFCLHKTAELTQLRAAFEDNTAFSEDAVTEPVKVSEVLSTLLSRLFGGSEGAVFAHEEKKENKTSPEDAADQDDEPKS